MNDSMTVSSTITAAPGASRTNDFWLWWTGELRALVPARVVGWVVGEVAVTDVMVDANTVKILSAEAGKTKVLADVPISGLATDTRLREMRAKGDDHVRVILAGDQVLLKSIILPAATEENLRDVMGFELDRHTPFTAAQVYYDVKLVRRDVQRDSIEVMLAAASRSTVDPLLATLRQAGLSIDAITVTDKETSGQMMELLPAADKPARKWGNLLRLNLGLLALAAILGLLSLLLPIWQKREQVIALNPLVGKASAEFELNQRVFDEYTRLANEYNYITGKKQGAQPSLAILEELTRISPDTTFVQTFELKTNPKAREVTLTGEAPAASRVIEVLEQSPYFQNASQKSPTRRGSLGTNEWFNIATELKPKPLPATLVEGEKPQEAVALPATPAVAPPAGVVNADPVGKSPAGVLPQSPNQGDKLQAPVATVTVPPPAKPATSEPPATVAPAPRKQP